MSRLHKELLSLNISPLLKHTSARLVRYAAIDWRRPSLRTIESEIPIVLSDGQESLLHVSSGILPHMSRCYNFEMEHNRCVTQLHLASSLLANIKEIILSVKRDAHEVRARSKTTRCRGWLRVHSRPLGTAGSSLWRKSGTARINGRAVSYRVRARNARIRVMRQYCLCTNTSQHHNSTLQ
jgi:hypothetical protein